MRIAVDHWLRKRRHPLHEFALALAEFHEGEFLFHVHIIGVAAKQHGRIELWNLVPVDIPVEKDILIANGVDHRNPNRGVVGLAGIDPGDKLAPRFVLNDVVQYALLAGNRVNPLGQTALTLAKDLAVEPILVIRKDVGRKSVFLPLVIVERVEPVVEFDQRGREVNPERMRDKIRGGEVRSKRVKQAKGS